jgi:hypothetical protein
MKGIGAGKVEQRWKLHEAKKRGATFQGHGAPASKPVESEDPQAQPPVETDASEDGVQKQ